MINREIPDNHADLLRTVLKQEVETEIPKSVQEIYWQVAITARRLGENIDIKLLILIAMLANRPTVEDPVSFLDTVKTLKRNDRVLAKYRNKWRWGLYQGVDDKKVQVMIEDDSAEVRNFQPTSVRLPSKEELTSIGA